MEIEFDQHKDRQNLRQHGRSLAFAAQLDWEWAYCWKDTRFHYDEVRMNSLVPSESGLFFVAYVERGDCIRILSLRKAKNAERRLYARVFNFE